MRDLMLNSKKFIPLVTLVFVLITTIKFLLDISVVGLAFAYLSFLSWIYIFAKHLQEEEHEEQEEQKRKQELHLRFVGCWQRSLDSIMSNIEEESLKSVDSQYSFATRLPSKTIIQRKPKLLTRDLNIAAWIKHRGETKLLYANSGISFEDLLWITTKYKPETFEHLLSDDQKFEGIWSDAKELYDQEEEKHKNQKARLVLFKWLKLVLNKLFPIKKFVTYLKELLNH